MNSMRSLHRLAASLALTALAACSSSSSSPAASRDSGATPDAKRDHDASTPRGDGGMHEPDARKDAPEAGQHDAGVDAGSVPLASDSPWPKFRANARQTGLGTVMPSTTGGTYFDFPTGKGVFSSPIVAGDGTVYVGSADQNYYALNADGSVRWKIETGEIIDSAGLLDDLGHVYFGSGDGYLRACDAKTGEVLWKFQADSPTTTGAYINWFEGNVAIGPSGALYAPNDDYRVYALDRTTGAVDWRFVMPDQTWSLPAVDPKSGTLYVGNNELIIGKNTYAISAEGGVVWETSSPGTVAASPVLTSDGTVIVGGFDGFIHAYKASDGSALWSTATRDHVYASAALLPDGTVVVPSADATVYALDPTTGAIKWTFDTPEPIRSSPAVDAAGNIYIGGGDGVLYVLGPTGTMRWSLRLIDQSRRNLNASAALGADAVYIGGESGDVFGVPYEYCLRASQATNTACSTTPPFSGAASADGASLIFTESFGGLDTTPPATIDANQALAFTLRVRENGQTQLAILDSATLAVSVTPTAAVTTALSGNGQFVVITPTTGFVPDGSGNVTVTISGNYLVGLERSGLALVPGTGMVGGQVSSTFTFALSTGGPSAIPLPVPAAPGDPSGVFEVSRVSLPLPTILPSYNQIGFDSLVYLIGFVEGTGTSGTAWMAGAKYLPGQATPVIDPMTGTLLPLAFTYQDGRITFANDDGLEVDVLNVLIPLDTFRISASVDATGNAAAGGRLTGDTLCSGIPTYGVFLQKLGFCNPQNDLLTVFGGANLGPYGSGTVSAPSGVGTVAFGITSSAVTATLTGSSLVAADHVASVLLLDATTGAAVPLSYGPITKTVADASGHIATVTVPLPTSPMPPLPTSIRAYLMIDTYPAAKGMLTLP
jgi:outer membrane protein assembly factor BamB